MLFEYFCELFQNNKFFLEHRISLLRAEDTALCLFFACTWSKLTISTGSMLCLEKLPKKLMNSEGIVFYCSGTVHGNFTICLTPLNQGSSRIFCDSSVTIAHWWRAQHLRSLVIRKVPGSIPAKNTSTQIHMDMST